MFLFYVLTSSYYVHISVVDRQRFDADPDPTFYFDADPYPPTLKLGQGKKMTKFERTEARQIGST